LPIQDRIATASGNPTAKTPICIVDGGRPKAEPVAQAGFAVVSKWLRFVHLGPYLRLDLEVWNGMMGKFGGHLLRAIQRRALQFAFVAAIMTAVSGLSGSAHAQGTVRSVHGDWQIRCDTPPGAQGEQCVLIQSVTAEDRPNIGLTVIILKTADKKSRIMRVIAPPGVLLPSGLGLKVDNAELGRAGFVRCVPNGCVAEVVMDDNLIGKMRTGQSATFIIFQTPEEGIGFPISLKGLGEGFDKLP
jgi:invasion protein IalB